MKICLSCSAEVLGGDWKCVKCGWSPENASDVLLFAPHIAGAGESYDPAWYQELASLESSNFWFVARNRLIQRLALRHLSLNSKYLEVGCGTGFVLRMLHKTFSNWSMFATEAQPEGIDFAKTRVTREVKFFQMDACAIPFTDEFDAIGAFDVIEHIRDDVKAINQIYAALKPNGYFILSVPQHMFLWSKYDETACHFRRYSNKELTEKLTAAGFSIVESTSFNTLLLPLMAASRYLLKNKGEASIDVLQELRLNPVVNFILSAVLSVEFQLIRLGVHWPIGGSRLVVAKKIIVNTETE
jgi:SAM-dependent methyltransferase